ncbi:zinc-ribbon domain-containing protein [Inediibacterium massiliense]|uniref:zinc-ribbon domain-containing protein n=1 Tax=Inediibacterium massiliense TaxID=1658111 RepID=UPI0006B569CB|nr:zinc-ribbon domain-containing protein [Inediibacterium massiliense]
MIIWGWGKVTRKIIGAVFQRSCSYCNSAEIWNLCIVRTWFTLFFIPIIPYRKQYCIACPRCGSYIELTKDEFEQMKMDISSSSDHMNQNPVSDNIKYGEKTETQINYLKQMEEYKNK